MDRALMFFLPCFSPVVTDLEKQIQRKYLYRSLYEGLQEKNSVLELVMPINQSIDAAITRLKGYCHGYGEVWTEQLDILRRQPAFQDWRALLGDEDYYLNSMPLSADIIQAQKDQSCREYGKKSFRQAVYCEGYGELLEEVVFQALESNKNSKNVQNNEHSDKEDKNREEKNNCGDEKYYHSDKKDMNINQESRTYKGLREMCVIDLAAMPGDSVKMVKSFFKKYPAQIKQWHEVRLYVDEEAYVHWFDSNIGWFRSRDPNPDHESFKRDLGAIFSILQYDLRYSVVAVSKRFFLKNKEEEKEQAQEQGQEELKQEKKQTAEKLW